MGQADDTITYTITSTNTVASDACDLMALVDAVEAASAALATAVTSSSLDDLDGDSLADTMRRLQVVTSQVSAVSALTASAWGDRGDWAAQGYRSARIALSTIAGVSPTSASRDLHRGRRLRRLPRTCEAVLTGGLRIDHADLLGRAAADGREQTFLEHEQLLVDECARLRWPHARRLVDYWVQHADALAAAERAQARALDVECHISVTTDDRTVLSAVLDSVGGEIVGDEMRRLERELWLADSAQGVSRSGAQRRAAALVEMAVRSASFSDTGRRMGPTFTVLIGDDTAAHLCQLASGALVHPSELLPHVDHALIESVLFDGPTTVVGVSSQRTFTGALRRAIIARDRFCTHASGCDVPAAQCDIDHIVPWSRGGPTTQTNGRALCPTHNRHPEHWSNHPPAAAPPSPTFDAHDLARVRQRWRLTRLPSSGELDAPRRNDQDVGEPPGAVATE